MSLKALQRRAQVEIARRFPGGKAEIHNGTHVHLDLPGWGKAPGLPPPPEGFEAVTATGEAHDGDTFKLSDGRNARLFGADAPELKQQGRRADGSLVPLGILSRDYMQGEVPGLQFKPTGRESWGRPEGTFGPTDPTLGMLRRGHGIAAPEHLEGSPQFGPYLEQERRARQNLLGIHGTNAETPEQFRKKDGPWKGAEPGEWGQGQAIFGDEPTPFQGLRPEIAEGYLAIWNDPNSKPEDLIAYAKANGFEISESDTRKRYEQRFSEGDVPDAAVDYAAAPKPLIDPGDGATGAAVRGVADPINFIDEFGAIADTLGVPTFEGPRENVWNSDRRFGDILWNNIDQNRAIIGHDDEHHWGARFGGQIASALAIPGLGARGVGTAAYKGVIEAGGSKFAAEWAARQAIGRRMAAIGGGEGGAAGAGAGEGGVIDRLPDAAQGALLGTAGGMALGEAARGGANLVRRLRNRPGGAETPAGGHLPPAAPVESPPSAASEGLTGGVPPIAPEMLQRVNGGAAMRADDAVPELVSDPVRQRDYLMVDGERIPPPPPGFVAEPIGRTQQMGERLTPEQMAALAEDVDPASVLPRPANMIEDLSEAAAANPGRFAEVEAPDERDALEVIKVKTAKGGTVNWRGPLSLSSAIRQMGGLRDTDGGLRALDLTNKPRRLPFGGNEAMLGRLINPENGRTVDEMTEALWEEGWFPLEREQPTPDLLKDLLRREQFGEPYYHPEALPMVERFDQTQADRFAIEQRADEGAPLVEERGHSINLDDLVANTPPVSAYEDAPRLTGKIGNINLDRLEKPGDVSQLIRQISQRVGGFDAAQRGRITHDETRRLAQEMGLKPEQLLKRRQGQALNAEEAYAARALVQRSRETVGRLAKRAVGGSDDDKLTFRKAWLKHVALEEQIAGATAEAGRLLSQFRMAASAGDAGGEAVRAYLKAGRGKESIEDAAEAIIDLMEDPAKASHFMREAVKPRWRDKINELWINSLLSGPRTHVVNFVGNSLTTALSFPELALTAGIGKLTRSADRAFFREVGARAVGLGDASVEALRAMRKAFATGEPSDAVTKVEAAHHRAIGGKVGHVLRTPTRALTAADEFWKTLLRSAETRQLAYRKAAVEAKDAGDLRDRYAELVRNPPDDIRKRADAAARYYTFQKPLGEAGRGVQQVSNNWVGGKLVLPFVRTPINLLKFAGERSMLGILMPEVRAAIKAGGRARDEAFAKILLGSGLSTAAMVAALDGRISGAGPSDPRERAAWLETNQPYSIKVGDQWVSYARFDPVSTLFGVAADVAEIGKWATVRELDVIALETATAIAKNLTNKTWLSGLSDAFDVLSDPERYGKNYVQRLAGSVAVPSLVNQASQSTDEYLRDARTILDGIKARVPVLSESVSPRLNVWGEPIERGNSVGPDLVSPFYAKQASRDPMKREMARIRAPLSMPQRAIFVDGKRVKLTQEQFARYVQLSGQPAKQYFSEFIKSPVWKHMTDDERREEVKESLAGFRDAARDELKRLYPELRGKSLPPPPAGARAAKSSNAAGDEFVIPPPPDGFELAQ
ncbi:MAG: thermonuclease family protein [Alphaproteobacteria bacterium]